MARRASDGKTPEEALVHGLIVSTWGLWIIGATYHAYSILPWVLFAIAAARRLGLTAQDPETLPPVPWTVWAWIGGMMTMVVALVAGHLDYDFGTLDIVKSVFGWAKGWALLAILPFAGATLQIRPQIVFRAANLLALQTLLIAPVFFVASKVGLPPVLYTSPLQYVGGAGRTFFEVGTHWIDPGADDARFRFYAPWAPAAAFASHVLLVLGLYDRNWRWRAVAVASAVVVCLLAKSRLSLVAIPVLLVALPILSGLYRPYVAALGGLVTSSAALAFPLVANTIETAMDRFASARKDSSRVRKVLQNIAIHRWWTEAPVFGHGTVERGPHVVEFMPIGSHHTWNGLLFVKGAVGWLALAVPMAITIVVLIVKAQRDPAARAGVGVLLVIFLNSFGENIEILAYLAWPGLLMLGIALKRRRVGIYAELLGCRR